MTDRLDEQKLEMLRAWGDGLSSDKRDELRAAGKAIIMLIEEIELLNVDLWHAREPGPDAGAERARREPRALDRQSSETGRVRPY